MVISFLAGMMLGGTIGVIAMAAMIASKDYDERFEA